jgi:hypothetical protein
MRLATIGFALVLLAALPAQATTVNVQITGTVEYNQVSIGQFGAVMPGDNVTIGFTLDSNDYLDSGSFPTRGYVIGNFEQTVGPATVHLKNPFPGVPYFVLRNNDPAVDGFFFSKGTDFPASLDLDEAANGSGTRFFGSHFEVGYGQTALSSLDILDAVGVYTFAGLTSFYFTIQDLGFDPIGFIFEQMTITAPVAVENETWGGIKALYR